MVLLYYKDIIGLLSAIATENHTASSLLMCEKDNEGRNFYWYLEQAVLTLSAEECAQCLERSKFLIETIIFFTQSLIDEEMKLPKDYFGSGMFDFFKSNQHPTVIRQLLDKLPDPKSAARLKTLLQMRQQMRFYIRDEDDKSPQFFNIDYYGDKLQPYLGLHDIQTELQHVLSKGSPDSEQQEARIIIDKWLAFEPQAECGSLLYATLFDMAHANANVQNATIVTLVLGSRPELLKQALQYTSPEDRSCLFPLLDIVVNVLKPQEGKVVPREISQGALMLLKETLQKMRSLQAVTQSDTGFTKSGTSIWLSQNCYGNNIMHLVVVAFVNQRFGASGNDVLRVFQECLPAEDIRILLGQKNDKGTTAMMTVKDRDTREEVEALLLPKPVARHSMHSP
jgi:hypothetical protein